MHCATPTNATCPMSLYNTRDKLISLLSLLVRNRGFLCWHATVFFPCWCATGSFSAGMQQSSFPAGAQLGLSLLACNSLLSLLVRNRVFLCWHATVFFPCWCATGSFSADMQQNLLSLLMCKRIFFPFWCLTGFSLPAGASQISYLQWQPKIVVRQSLTLVLLNKLRCHTHF